MDRAARIPPSHYLRTMPTIFFFGLSASTRPAPAILASLARQPSDGLDALASGDDQMRDPCPGGRIDGRAAGAIVAR